MLMCSSKLPVKESLTIDAFVCLAIDWVTSSRNYTFSPFIWDGTADYCERGEKGELFQIGLFENGKKCAIHFRSTDNRSIEWTSDFIFDTVEHLLAFQLYRDAPAGTEYVPPKFSLPRLIEMILEAGYSGADNGIVPSAKPILIHDISNEIDLAVDTILQKSRFNLPVIYVSCITDGHCAVNPWAIAEELNGVAHVIFETSRSVSYALRDATGGKNPYGGAIDIFYSNGSRRILPAQLTGTTTAKIRAIKNAVYNHLIQLRVDDGFLWSHLQSQKLREQLRLVISKKETDSEEFRQLSETYEELLAEKENEIKKLSDQVNSLNATVAHLEARLSVLEEIPLLVQGTETDLYPGEQQAIVLEALQKQRELVKANGRRMHILNSLIEANATENAVEKKRSRLKACLHGYTRMTPTIRKELEDLGFTITDEGKHYKLVFGEDARYTGTLSKTGSDHRGGDNTAHDLLRDIF